MGDPTRGHDGPALGAAALPCSKPSEGPGAGARQDKLVNRLHFENTKVLHRA